MESEDIVEVALVVEPGMRGPHSIGRVVATYAERRGLAEWSAEAEVRRARHSGQAVLRDIAAAAAIPQAMLARLRAAIRAAWHCGGDVAIRGPDGEALTEEAAIRVLRPVLRDRPHA